MRLSNLSKIFFLSLFLVIGCVTAVKNEEAKHTPIKNFGFGEEPSKEILKSWSISIPPDGENLPAGKGTFLQGKELYFQQCAACHGVSMEGSKEISAPALKGGRGSLTSQKPLKTIESYWPFATTLFDYIRRAMPFGAPGNLATDEIYSLCAYILGEGGIHPVNQDLTREKLMKITMPNRSGFIEKKENRKKYGFF